MLTFIRVFALLLFIIPVSLMAWDISTRHHEHKVLIMLLTFAIPLLSIIGFVIKSWFAVTITSGVIALGILEAEKHKNK